uniref:Reverse transcriptase domain-containing protein n=1 Tax=Latimeria chalumnae TaxID=7897 RepID=H3BF14_LATCH
MLFAIYLLPLGDIARRYGVDFHCYADDVQLYFAFPANNTSPVAVLEQCLGAIWSWLAGSWLKLNQSKSEVLLVGRGSMCEKFINSFSPPMINGESLKSVKVTKSLGVFLDSSLTMERQISSVVSAGFFHLRNIKKLCPLLPHDSLATLMHTFILSRIDYCNALYVGLPLKLIHRLQLVQNSAAHVVKNMSRFDHITPVLLELHWLPVRWRITFKVLVLVFKALNGLGPEYLRHLLTPYVPARLLRSLHGLLLKVPMMKTKVGECSFSFCAVTSWNALPINVRTSPSLSTFKSSLKAFLFRAAFNLS